VHALEVNRVLHPSAAELQAHVEITSFAPNGCETTNLRLRNRVCTIDVVMFHVFSVADCTIPCGLTALGNPAMRVVMLSPSALHHHHVTPASESGGCNCSAERPA
jgi:hypothetical protein